MRIQFPKPAAMRNWLCEFGRNNDGATSIEYVFLIALIALAVITSYTAFATEMSDLWDFINTSFVDA